MLADKSYLVTRPPRTLALLLVGWLTTGCQQEFNVRPDADPDQPEPAEGLQFVEDGAWAVEWAGAPTPWSGCSELELSEQGTLLTWSGGCGELQGEMRDFCRCFPHYDQGERRWCLCPNIESLYGEIQVDGDVTSSIRARLR
jgi:hypothetical protein